jgi:hypothetical protein
MSFIRLHYTIQKKLISSFALLDEWLDRDAESLNFKPPEGASISGLVKGIVINNQHLLQVDLNPKPAVNQDNYRLRIYELEQGARHWRLPGEENVFADHNLLRAQLRLQLDTALCLLEHATLIADEQNPLAYSDDDSWDGYHRLYFIGALIMEYIERFKSVLCTEELMVSGE